MVVNCIAVLSSNFFERLPGTPFEDGSGQQYVSFSYSENKSAVGVTYIVERSTDLKTWGPIDLSSASVNRLDRDSFTEVTIFIPASGVNGFFRVRIE